MHVATTTSAGRRSTDYEASAACRPTSAKPQDSTKRDRRRMTSFLRARARDFPSQPTGGVIRGNDMRFRDGTGRGRKGIAHFLAVRGGDHTTTRRRRCHGGSHRGCHQRRPPTKSAAAAQTTDWGPIARRWQGSHGPPRQASVRAGAALGVGPPVLDATALQRALFRPRVVTSNDSLGGRQ
jgi:hypothetical protein